MQCCVWLGAALGVKGARPAEAGGCHGWFTGGEGSGGGVQGAACAEGRRSAGRGRGRDPAAWGSILWWERARLEGEGGQVGGRSAGGILGVFDIVVSQLTGTVHCPRT